MGGGSLRVFSGGKVNTLTALWPSVPRVSSPTTQTLITGLDVCVSAGSSSDKTEKKEKKTTTKKFPPVFAKL